MKKTQARRFGGLFGVFKYIWKSFFWYTICNTSVVLDQERSGAQGWDSSK